MNVIFSERQQFSLTGRWIINRKVKLMKLCNNNVSISEKPLINWLELMCIMHAGINVYYGKS